MDPRRPDDFEWGVFSNWFPKLVKNDVWVTAEPTAKYNCVSFTLGIYDRWIKPVSPLAGFEKQYGAFDYVPVNAANASVDGWGFTGTKPNQEKMTHGSRPSADRVFAALGLWESKLGNAWQITHARNALVTPIGVGEEYGSVLTSLGEDDLNRPGGGRPQPPDMEPEITGDERALLVDAALEEVDDAELIGEFALRREDFLRAVGRSASSDIARFAAMQEFGALVALGRRIAPLIVAQLDDERGFFLLGALEAVRPELTAIEYDPLAGEQSLARLVARTWLAR